MDDFDTKAPSLQLDAEFFSSWMKRMDEDVALSFVLSGLSLNRNKTLEAFDVACQIMDIRTSNKLKSEKFSIDKQKSVTELVESLLASIDAKKLGAKK